jgi:NAD(P)-dependent dehydrogenase (short-subunit alcohol dehydrogenase family)
MRFAGRTAIVTGGSSGIGRASALRLAAEGARVVIASRRLAVGEEVVSEITRSGGAAYAVGCDVTIAAQVESCVAETMRKFGAPSMLVHAAGSLGKESSVTDLDEHGFDELVSLNLKGAYNVTRAVLPLMAKTGGAIITISSIGGYDVLPRAAAYGASKAGVISLTRSIALDYASFGVRAICLCPGLVETPMLEGVLGRDRESFKARAQWMSLHPLGRLGKAEDIASAVAFFASDEASWITGITVPIDGGWLLRRFSFGPPEL